MKYTTAYVTDKGKRNSNQDSLLIKKGEYFGKTCMLLAVADGVGGLSDGEIASGTVVNDLSEWFVRLLASGKEKDINAICTEIQDVLSQAHTKINTYIFNTGNQLGSTVVLVFICESRYIAINVGDSRLYMFDSGACRQINVDDSCGNHVLTQCIGARQNMQPHIYDGIISEGVGFLLCSDGFYGKIEESEIKDILEQYRSKEDQMVVLEKYKNIMLSREEKDNMTAVTLQIGN
ncbi:MAG: serine/threonine-protein phosphatase [Lachnospiraceae bacterium]|nr:serine/threonine-protein phosphatase [Lachnospiraceae bacterium]